MKALVALTRALVLRLLREGLVLRALLWPGLLCALTMFLMGSVVLALRATPPIVVSDAAVARRLEADGFRVSVDADPRAVLASGLGVRGIWKEGDVFVYSSLFSGHEDLRAESILREVAGGAWRIDVAASQAVTAGDARGPGPAMHALACVLGILFTLYGVVIGAGALYRDRASGALESELSLAVPRWMHAASRLAALALVLGPALAVSLLVLDSLLPIEHLAQWCMAGTLSALGGGTLGLVTMARATTASGFSGALSRGLTAATALLAFGWSVPALGRFLPVASLSSAVEGSAPSPLATLLLLAAMAAAAWDFDRREVL